MLLGSAGADNIAELNLFLQLKHYAGLTERIFDQTEPRVIKGEKFPASERMVSIFDEHTDIIVKDRRDTFFGHQICLTGGKSKWAISDQSGAGRGICFQGESKGCKRPRS